MFTVDRLLGLMEAREITAKELENSAGLATSSVSQWKKGKGKPSLENIIKLSTYFGVSSDYLLGLSDRDISFLSKEENLLLDIFNNCSAEDRFRIIQLCMNIKDEKGISEIAG